MAKHCGSKCNILTCFIYVKLEWCPMQNHQISNIYNPFSLFFRGVLGLFYLDMMSTIEIYSSHVLVPVDCRRSSPVHEEELCLYLILYYFCLVKQHYIAIEASPGNWASHWITRFLLWHRHPTITPCSSPACTNYSQDMYMIIAMHLIQVDEIMPGPR